MFGATVLGAAGESGSSAYQISNSLRFDGVDDYLESTTVAPTSAYIKTFLFWLKEGATTSGSLYNCSSGASTSSARMGIRWDSSTGLEVYQYNGSGYDFRVITNRLFRDPTGHKLIRVSIDTTQATASNRIQIQVNLDPAETSFSSASYPSQNSSPYCCTSGKLQRIGVDVYNGSTEKFSGYLSEYRIIDGGALSTAVCELNADNVPVPKAYSGSHGASGSFLDFADGTSTTTLGYDAAGSNDWTLSGMTRAAGVNECWMVDTPTDNFAVLNVLQNPSSATVSQGNLKAISSASYKAVPATVAIASGKWYWELVALSPTRNAVGVAQVTSADITSSGNYIGQNSTSWSMFVEGTNALKKYNNGTGTDFSPTLTASANDVFMVAMDADSGKIYFGKNGTWAGSADPANGTNPAYSSMTGPYFPAMSVYDGTGAAINFGQRDFAYTPPTGFKALCTANRTYSAPTTSGSFTGNSSADGPYVWLNGNPETMTINGNAVTWGTHADKLAGGFKVRNSTSSYNASGSNTFSVTSSGQPFGDSTHAPNTAKGNP